MGCLKLTYENENPILFLEREPEETDTLHWQVWVNPAGGFWGVGEVVQTQEDPTFNAESYVDGLLKMNVGDKVTGKEISKLLKSLNADLPLDVADVIKSVTRVKGGLQINLTLLARGALAIVPKTPNVENGAIITITRETWTDNKNSVLHLVSPDIEIYYNEVLVPLNIYLNNNGFTMKRDPYPSYYPILKGKW